MTVRSLLFEAKAEERDVELDDRVVRSLGKDRLLWVDVSRDDGDELGEVARILGIPDALLPAAPTGTSVIGDPERGNPRGDGSPRARGPARPFLNRQHGWARLSIVAVEPPPDDAPATTPIARTVVEVIAGENVVVTAHDAGVLAIEGLEEQLRGEPGVGVLDAADLIAALVDEVLVLYLRHAEQIERRIDVLDEVAIRGREVASYLPEVVSLRRRVAELRRTLAPHRAAFAPLARPDFEIGALGRPWPGLLERLESTLAALEADRDLLVGSVELHQSSTAQRVNDVMKRLTIVNAVLLPSVVLAGIMGMNFRIPFFEDASNFTLVLGGMIGLAIGTLVLARLRGWL